MAKLYAIMRFKPIKSTQGLTRAYNHNFRENISSNVDPDRIFMNKEIVKLPDEDFTAAYKRRLEEGGVKSVQKNHTKAIETILTYSEKLARENFDIDKWAQMNVEWLQKTFGKENVVSVVLHMDETAPHLHAIIIPVKDGRLAATELLESTPEQVKAHHGTYGYKYLQDQYADYMTSLGLHRGISSSPATHEDMKDFRASLGEYSHDKLPEPEPEESLEKYSERANEAHRDMMIGAFKKIKTLEREVVELQGEIQNQPTDNAQLRAENIELQRQIKELSDAEITAETKKKAEMLTHIMTAINNGYPDEESKEDNLAFLAELNKAGVLIERGMDIESIKAAIEKELSEIEKA